MSKLSFIVPCYNEEKNIALFYEDVLKNFQNSKYNIELVFINDGSKDNTMNELKKLIHTKQFSIKIINFSRNFGKESGIYAGLKKCTGDYAVIIDCDMQQPPKLVLDMLKVIEKDEDIDIVTYYQEKRIEGKFISFCKNCFYKLIDKLTQMNFVNAASDFRLLNRKAIDAILSLSEHNRFSKGIFNWIGFNNYYLPYTPETRKFGETSWGFKKLIDYALTGILAFIKNPLRVLFNFGVMNILLAIIVFVILLISSISSESIAYIYPFILFIFGINSIVLGYIGEFISSSYDEVKNRPIYIVKDIYTNEKDH